MRSQDTQVQLGYGALWQSGSSRHLVPLPSNHLPQAYETET